MTTKDGIDKSYEKHIQGNSIITRGMFRDAVEDISKMETSDLIGKDIRCTDDEPQHGKIVAIDIHNRMIMEFDGTGDDVFAYKTMEEAHCVFEKPEEVEEIIEHNGRKYKLLAE